ncbi:hypothetical protein EAX61_07580 [Dokdonia sinensis]|uniref:DoxX family protein n=1 Tax=Dokdonia sinensis TaxID=2479847 RepID=A0A3M0GE63_9FLAO|nr:DoxX family protein [Dokdonia sinensis]RMB59439.1 hypothetical protein EAX61_07580 [Dokdonia sinensis]
MKTLLVLILFSSVSFLFFGIGCFIDPRMKAEFIRYNLDKHRPLVGALQVAGAVALLIGYFYIPLLAFIGAVGLSVLMLFGFGVRLKIKDTPLQSSPSLIYCILNAVIAYSIYVNMLYT